MLRDRAFLQGLKGAAWTLLVACLGLAPRIASAATCSVNGTDLPCDDALRQAVGSNLFSEALVWLLSFVPQGMQASLVTWVWVAVAVLIGFVVSQVFYLGFWVMMLVHASRGNTSSKPAWIASILLTPPVGYLPPIGASVYYFMVKRKQDAPAITGLEDVLPGAATLSSKPPSKLFTDYYAGAFCFMIAAFAAAAIFLIRPIIIEIKETQSQITASQQELTQARNQFETLGRSVAASEAIPQDTLERVSQALPTDPQFSLLLAELSAAAIRNGARMNLVSFTEPKVAPVQTGAADPGVNSVLPADIAVNLESSGYFDVKRFLADIEASLRLMDVVSIGLSSNEDGGMKYNLHIKTYVFSPGGTAPVAAAGGS